MNKAFYIPTWAMPKTHGHSPSQYKSMRLRAKCGRLRSNLMPGYLNSCFLLRPLGIKLLIDLALLCSCGKTFEQSIIQESVEPSPIYTSIPSQHTDISDQSRDERAGDMTQTKRIESIDSKGPEECNTLEIIPDIFFQTEAAIRSAIVTADGKLYFGNENCQFYALDISSKQILWIYTTDKPMQTRPICTDGKVIFNAENSLYILDAETGDEIHKITYPSDSTRRVSSADFAYNDSYVAVSDGIAYFAACNGDIAATDIEKGEIIWMLPAEARGPVASGINFYEGNLYYVNGAGVLCCVSTQTRQTVFKRDISDKVYAPIFIDGGKVYIAGRSCKVFCIDANSGEVIWSSYSISTTSWFSGGSVSIGNTLYTCTSDEHTLLAFDKHTGEFLRSYPIELNGYTQPLLHGRNIIVAATNVYTRKSACIMEFDTQSHTKVWQALLKDSVLSSPAMHQGILYFGSDSGAVYSINLVNTPF